MRIIKYIILHTTAGPQTQTLASIQSYWKSKGWKRPGYHHMLMPDGKIVDLLPIEEISNGVQGFNAHSINISYIGGVDANGRLLDNRTPQQKAAMKELVIKYMAMFPEAKVLGHRDFSPDKNRDGIIQENEWMKSCPSFSVAQWLKEEGILDKHSALVIKKAVHTQSGNGVNLRKGPGTEYDIITKLKESTAVILGFRINGWYFVTVSDTIDGWVKEDYLK